MGCWKSETQFGGRVTAGGSVCDVDDMTQLSARQLMINVHITVGPWLCRKPRLRKWRRVTFYLVNSGATPESQAVRHWLILLSRSHNPTGTKQLRPRQNRVSLWLLESRRLEAPKHFYFKGFRATLFNNHTLNRAGHPGIWWNIDVPSLNSTPSCFCFLLPYLISPLQNLTALAHFSVCLKEPQLSGKRWISGIEVSHKWL